MKSATKELEEGWFIDNISTRRPVYDTLKRVSDVVIALVAFVILFVPGLVIAILIKFSSRGPIVYTQDRTGKNGKKFTYINLEQCELMQMVPHGREK